VSGYTPRYGVDKMLFRSNVKLGEGRERAPRWQSSAAIVACARHAARASRHMKNAGLVPPSRTNQLEELGDWCSELSVSPHCSGVKGQLKRIWQPVAAPW
jgi:hypothetical protein